jgi:hypothetical protein
MTRGKDEPHDVIVDHLIHGALQSISELLLLPFQLPCNVFVFVYEHAAAP